MSGKVFETGTPKVWVLTSMIICVFAGVDRRYSCSTLARTSHRETGTSSSDVDMFASSTLRILIWDLCLRATLEPRFVKNLLIAAHALCRKSCTAILARLTLKEELLPMLLWVLDSERKLASS